MKNKRVKIMLCTAALAAIISTGGIAAYFTDGDEAVNTFTVGRISLDLQEPEWDPEDGKDVTPLKKIKKDPQIKNDGVNAEFVYMKVSVPYAYIVTANADGTKNPATDTELFSYTVKEGWTELADYKEITENTVTRLYVYGTEEACTVLEKNVTTPPLFESVTTVNFVEDQGLEETSPEIVIKAYGIQTTDLNGGKTDPEGVWAILKTQAPSETSDVAEDEKTDIKESQ